MSNLIANLERVSVSQDGSLSTWDDETVYGGSNPDRNEVALYLTAYKVDNSQNESALVVSGFDPEVVTTFITNNGALDGWVRYYFIIVDNYSALTQYEQYDMVWDVTQNQFYEYINATPSTGQPVTNPVYWLATPDPTTKIRDVGTAEESGNIAYQIINKILTYQTSICYAKAAGKNAKENCGDCGCNTTSTKIFHRIRDLFANMVINESTGQFLEGEKNARLAEKYCDDCGCSNS